jgi:hypothetical protein
MSEISTTPIYLHLEERVQQVHYIQRMASRSSRQHHQAAQACSGLGLVLPHGTYLQPYGCILLYRNTPYESVKTLHGGLLALHPPYVKN